MTISSAVATTPVGLLIQRLLISDVLEAKQ